MLLPDQGPSPDSQPLRDDQLPPRPRLGERPPWEVGRGWPLVAAVLLLVAAAGLAAVVVASFAVPLAQGRTSWGDLVPPFPSPVDLAPLLGLLALGRVVRRVRRELERRSEPHLRLVEALVVDRRWRPAPRRIAGGPNTGASSHEWADVRARPYQATLEHVVDGQAHRAQVFTAEEPIIGTS